MSTPYDYNVIANLNMNIRVSRDIVLMNEFGEEISRTPDIQYSQAMLDLSDIEDEDERNNFLWNLGIVYQSADGFCLNDDEGNNYSINLIFEYLKKNGKIDFYELKKTMI